MGLFRLFDGARARERYSLLAKDLLRGHKSPICEECRKSNFLLENLAWENAGRSASERFPSDPRTHISPIIVHRALFFREGGWWKVSGKRAGRGVALPLHGVLHQVVGLILLKIPIEQSHGVSYAWLLANMLGVKKSHVAHRFRGREGNEGEAVCWHGCVFER